MPAALLDGNTLAQTMREETAAAVKDFLQAHGTRPGLAAVLVGDHPASRIYVRNKRKACEQVGMKSWLHQLPASTTQDELLHLIAQLNIDPQVSGILVQLPLPKQIVEGAVIDAVGPL